MEDVIIIGGGPAGLGAGLYASRYSLKTLVIGKELGGTCNKIPKIENWLGNPGMPGVELVKNFVDHVKQNKVKIIEDEVSSILKEKDNFVVVTEHGKYSGKSLILANGMKHRELNIPGEKKYSGNGVHYCFTCDGPLYKNLVVGVVGGSDSAVAAAVFLESYAKKVYIFYRGKELRAEPALLKKLKNVEIIYNVNLKEIYGDKFVKGVKTDSGKDIKLDGIFIEAGNIPLTELVKNIDVKLDDKGFIMVDKNMATSSSGVFAAGDICDATSLRQVITAVATGSIAAQGAYNYLKKK